MVNSASIDAFTGPVRGAGMKRTGLLMMAALLVACGGRQEPATDRHDGGGCETEWTKVGYEVGAEEVRITATLHNRSSRDLRVSGNHKIKVESRYHVITSDGVHLGGGRTQLSGGGDSILSAGQNRAFTFAVKHRNDWRRIWVQLAVAPVHDSARSRDVWIRIEEKAPSSAADSGR